MIYSFDGREAPPNERRTEHLIMAGSGLSDAEIQRIRAIGDALETRPVGLFGAAARIEVNRDRVDATGSHFVLNDETRWAYDRLAPIVRDINDRHFGYDLSGFAENFYYLSYGPGQHFDWHLDQGIETATPRKLSLILQLSDPAEYDGGDFEVMRPADAARADKGKGLIMAFPAHKIHRVTPVTRGIRRSLAMFVCGPPFR